MSWAKLDDGFADNLKVDKLSWAARGVWVTGLCWCSRKLSDGRISARAARLHEFPDELISELVESGLWEVATDGDGWLVHDYLEYNPSKAEVIALRDAAKKRMATIRSKRSGPVCGSSREHVVQEYRPTSSPTPDPDPVQISSEEIDLHSSLLPNSAARAREMGEDEEWAEIHELSETKSAEKVGYEWWLQLTCRPIDFASWRSQFARIGKKPGKERAAVAKHYAETDYIIERPSKYGPEHVLKFWHDFIVAPRNMLAPKPLVPTRDYGPGRVSTREELERAAANNPDWVEAAQ